MMNSFSMEEAVAELPVEVTCGKQRHIVVMRVAAWGDVSVVFNPCEILPSAALCLAGSGCADQVHELRRSAAELLQETWRARAAGVDGNRRLFPNELAVVAEFAERVRSQRCELAMRTLIEHFGHLQHETHESRFSRALSSSDPWLRWAALVQIAASEDDSLPTLALGYCPQAVGWPLPLQLALLHATSGQVSRERTELLSLTMRDPDVSLGVRLRFMRELSEQGSINDARLQVALLKQRDERMDYQVARMTMIERLVRRVTEAAPAKIADRDPQLLELVKDCVAAAIVEQGRHRYVKMALSRIAELVYPELEHLINTTTDVAQHRSAVTFLGYVSVDRAAALVLELLREAPDQLDARQPLRAAVTTMCSRLENSPSSRRFLDQLLSIAPPPLALVALDTLGSFQSFGTNTTILRHIQSSSSLGIRMAGTDVIGRFGDHRMLSPLADMLEVETHTKMQVVLGDAITSILLRTRQSSQSIDTLARLANMTNERVADLSSKLLTEHPSPDALQALPIEFLERNEAGE